MQLESTNIGAEDADNIIKSNDEDAIAAVVDQAAIREDDECLPGSKNFNNDQHATTAK